MVRESFAIIANPTAGHTRSKRLKSVVDHLRKAGAKVEVVVTGSPGEGTVRAGEAVRAGHDAIVAAGGDGTVNEVLNGMADSGIALGVIPFGTANVLAAETGMPRRVHPLAEMLLDGRELAARPGRLGDHLFLLMAGAGLDAEIVDELDPGLKRMIGKVAYIRAAWKRIARAPLSRLIVTVGDQRLEGCLAIASKCRCYAGRIILAPRARLESGKFEVCVFSSHNRIRLIHQMLAVRFSVHIGMRDVHFLHGDRVHIESVGTSLLQTDGDLRGELPADLQVDANPIRLIVPE